MIGTHRAKGCGGKSVLARYCGQHQAGQAVLRKNCGVGEHVLLCRAQYKTLHMQATQPIGWRSLETEADGTQGVER